MLTLVCVSIFRQVNCEPYAIYWISTTFTNGVCVVRLLFRRCLSETHTMAKMYANGIPPQQYNHTETQTISIGFLCSSWYIKRTTVYTLHTIMVFVSCWCYVYTVHVCARDESISWLHAKPLQWWSVMPYAQQGIRLIRSFSCKNDYR